MLSILQTIIYIKKMFSKITIVAIGKTQQEFKEAENHYIKQIKSKIQLSILSPLSHLSEQEQILKESILLQKSADNSELTVVLDSSGSELSSSNFSDRLQSWSRNAKSISFIIGGSHGISDTVKKNADFILSMSKFTMPHQIARILLLEQIYRAETIAAGGKYHK